jgi:hypothetical protein
VNTFSTFVFTRLFFLDFVRNYAAGEIEGFYAPIVEIVALE